MAETKEERQPNGIDDALARIVTDAVASATKAVTVTREWWDEFGGWWIQVRPTTPGACPFEVGYDGDDIVNVCVGRATSFEVFPVTSEAQLQDVDSIVNALVGGRVEESGIGGGFARLWDETQTSSWIVGRAHLPWPRTARLLKRRFHPY